MGSLDDQESEPMPRLILDAHGRLKRDTKELPRSHPSYFVPYVKSSFPVNHHKGYVRIRIVVWNLLTRLKTDLIHLKIFLVY
jgi:hypothetical protein